MLIKCKIHNKTFVPGSEPCCSSKNLIMVQEPLEKEHIKLKLSDLKTLNSQLLHKGEVSHKHCTSFMRKIGLVSPIHYREEWFDENGEKLEEPVLIPTKFVRKENLVWRIFRKTILLNPRLR